MILIAAAENTDIMIGCADEKHSEVLFKETLSADLRKTPVEYSIAIKQVLELHNINICDIAGGIIASCVPSLTDTLKTAMKQLLHKNILEVGPGIRTGLDIRIDDPAELGADLIAAAAAGIAEYGAPLVIINLCTLTTLSVIDRDRHFIGAIFMPGIRLSADAVSHSAANLPDIAIRRSQRFIGATSAESIQSGVIDGCSAAIDGLLDKITHELDCPDMIPVITGEHSALIASCCRHHTFTDEHLILKGLILIYNKNKRTRS